MPHSSIHPVLSQVRAAMAGSLMDMTPDLGKNDTIQHVVPVILQLLKDEIPDVRLSVISKLAKINQVIGIDLLAQVGAWSCSCSS